jgi:phosphoribosylformylglycinamidine synthase
MGICLWQTGSHCLGTGYHDRRPAGCSAFNNEFGRPNLAGYFRTFEQQFGDEVRGYHKPIMLAGGVGNIADRDAFKIQFPAGTLLIQLGGPGMLIGLGGGAASSMATGSNSADLDFASVQRGNPEMQRRAQEVIDRCWQMGEDNPVLAIHDVGAGGLSNALPELAHDAGCGAIFDLRAVQIEAPGMSPREIWSNEAQERYVLAVAPARLDEFRAMCERERCPFAVLGVATKDGHLAVTDAHFNNRPVDMPLEVLLGKPRACIARLAVMWCICPLWIWQRLIWRKPHTAYCACQRGLEKLFITIGDRSVGGMTARDQMVGRGKCPWLMWLSPLWAMTPAVVSCFALGERTPLALLDGPASGRMAIARQ